MKALGGEAVVKTLQTRGITDAFGIVGSSILEIFNLLPAAGIKYYGVRHEQIGALMAEGYARVSRRPAVCLAQNGGGVTNLVTGVANAMKSHSPLVIIAGTPGSTELDLDTFQETNQLGLMQEVTKWAGRVPRADRLAEYVARAINTASAFPMGPAYVEIPRDYLYETIEIDEHMLHRGHIETRTAPHPDALRLSTNLLNGAHRPVIVAGAGVVWSDASEAVCALAELLGAPMVTSYYHNDAISSSHPMALGSLGRGGSKAAINAVKEADLVLALGTRLDSYGFMPQYGIDYYLHPGPDVKIIQVEIDPLRFDRCVHVDVGITSDVGAYVDAQISIIRAESPQWRSKSHWTADDLKARRDAWAHEMREAAVTPAKTKNVLTNAQAYAALNEILPKDAVRVVDIGSTPSYCYRAETYARPGTLLAPGYLGSLGFAFSAAMGASIASPDGTVVAFLGDGSMSMMLSGLFTAVEYQINMIAIVFDNGVWGAEWKNQDVFNNGKFVGSELKNSDLASIATAMGCWASPRATTQDEVRSALTLALKLSGPRIVVIEVDRWSLPAPGRMDALHVPERYIYPFPTA